VEWFRSHTTTLSPSPTLFQSFRFFYVLSLPFPSTLLLVSFCTIAVNMIIKLKTHLLRQVLVLRIYPFYEKNAFYSRILNSCLFLKHPSSAQYRVQIRAQIILEIIPRRQVPNSLSNLQCMPLPRLEIYPYQIEDS
jgi:hypothetical protein